MLLLSFWLVVSAQSTPLSPFGYLDFSYTGYTGAGSPTGEKPESKLWWNDGFWWGSLFDSVTNSYHIYRLNWGTQTWEDTGIMLDDRPNTKADVLWDGAANKLYVASPSPLNRMGKNRPTRPIGNGFTATPTMLQQTYTLDSGFPTTVNRDRTETLVLTKGAAGTLWITFVSRGTTANPNRDYRVFVNSSSDDGLTWGTSFVPTLDVTPEAVHVARGDLSAMVAFGSNVGVMWNNTVDDDNHTLHFAYRTANNTSNNDPWTHQMITVPGGADDHISIRALQATSDGQVFAAIKTSTPLTDPLTQTVALIGLVARDTNGDISFHMYSRNTDKDTRPTLVIDEGDLANGNDNKAYIFVAGKEGGSKICYKSLDIKSPLSSMGNFPTGDCGTSLIEDLTYKYINNPTSMKQNANKTTGIVVLASDDIAPTTTQVSRVYVHNVLGNPPPVVTAKGPVAPAVVGLSSVVTATFSKPINPSTLSTSTFSVEDSNGPIAGTISYDAGSRTATFIPDAMLAANTNYTAKLTNGIQDTSGQGLNQGIDAGPVIEQWTFSTGITSVEFAAAAYSVNEVAGTATITVVLTTPSAQAVTVDYATSDGTAGAGSDYTATNGTLTFAAGETVTSFTVPILNDAEMEGAETVNLTLSNPTSASLGLLTTATLTIIDDESTTVQFTSANFSADENSGQAMIEVTLSRAAAFSVTVDYATSSGTATAGNDYTDATGTLTFAPGELSKSFSITITDDTVFESNETINLGLSNVTPVSVTTNAPGNSAVLTIVDNDAQPTVKFSSATYTVNEAAGTATVTATLSAISSGSVTVKYASSNGTAIAGTDYTAATGTLTFAPGEVSKTFTVDITNDSLDEADEVINLQLSAPSGATLGAPFNATVTVVDDDAAPTVQFSTATVSADENDDTVEVVVTLSAPSGKLVTVDYASSNGTATEGEDYAAATGTLNFSAGETSKVIEISLLDDEDAENDETVTLTLSNPNSATLGAQSSNTLTIVDDDDTVNPPVGNKVYLPLIQK
ncbi:MAG: Calx-beta domain-containing protein [Caldilineaceae bacterium]